MTITRYPDKGHFRTDVVPPNYEGEPVLFHEEKRADGSFGVCVLVRRMEDLKGNQFRPKGKLGKGIQKAKQRAEEVLGAPCVLVGGGMFFYEDLFIDDKEVAGYVRLVSFCQAPKVATTPQEFADWSKKSRDVWRPVGGS
jgi:hypothetical protein